MKNEQTKTFLGHNGHIVAADAPIFGAGNRVFRYGDGLFESIRIVDGQACFLERHIARLKKGMALLQYTIPSHYQAEYFQQQINLLTGDQGHHRLRLTVYRQEGGFYAPVSNEPLFLMEVAALPQPKFQLNGQGLVLGICNELELSDSPLSSIKSCNSLPYVLAGKFLQQSNFDECILLNTYGRIAECSSGNLFIIKGKKLITPPLEEACIEGVMRGILIDYAAQIGLKMVIRPIQIAELEVADEILITNAIRGIRWIGTFGECLYPSFLAHQLIELINAKSE